MTPQHVTVYRQRIDLSLCYPLMWNVTLKYITTHFNVLGHNRSGNPSQTFQTQQWTPNFMTLMVVVSQKLCWKCTVLAKVLYHYAIRIMNVLVMKVFFQTKFSCKWHGVNLEFTYIFIGSSLYLLSLNLCVILCTHEMLL